MRRTVMPTMTRCALASTLARFVAVQPNVVVRITEAYSAVLTPQVRAGELDFAVVPAFGDATGLRGRQILRTPEVLVSRFDSGLPHLAGVRLGGLGPLRLVVPGPCNTRRHGIDAYLASNDVRIERLAELDAMLGTLDLVASAGWVTILPGVMMASEAVPEARRMFTVSPLAHPPLALALVVIEPARCALPAAAAAFLDVLKEETTRLNRVWMP